MVGTRSDVVRCGSEAVLDRRCRTASDPQRTTSRFDCQAVLQARAPSRTRGWSAPDRMWSVAGQKLYSIADAVQLLTRNGPHLDLIVRQCFRREPLRERADVRHPIGCGPWRVRSCTRSPMPYSF